MTTLILFLIFAFFGWKILAHNSQDKNPREYRNNNTGGDDDPGIYHHVHLNQEERQGRTHQGSGSSSTKSTRRQDDDDGLLIHELNSMNHNGMMYGMTNGILTYMMLDSILDNDHHVTDHDTDQIVDTLVIHDHLDYDDSLDMSQYDNNLETLYDNDNYQSYDPTDDYDATDSFDSMDDFDGFDDF